MVITNNAEQLGMGAEVSQIPCDISRAARDEAFLLEFDDWDWSLGGNAIHFAPKKMVKHNIPQHHDARLRGGGEDLPDTRLLGRMRKKFAGLHISR